MWENAFGKTVSGICSRFKDMSSTVNNKNHCTLPLTCVLTEADKKSPRYLAGTVCLVDSTEEDAADVLILLL